MSSMIAKPSDDGNCTNWFMPNATESLTGTAGTAAGGGGAFAACGLSFRFPPAAGAWRFMLEAS